MMDPKVRTIFDAAAREMREAGMMDLAARLFTFEIGPFDVDMDGEAFELGVALRKATREDPGLWPQTHRAGRLLGLAVSMTHAFEALSYAADWRAAMADHDADTNEGYTYAAHV